MAAALAPARLLKRSATPLTTALFLVSTVSGTALFFHLGTAWFREMHEILSLALVVPVAAHLWRNWPALVGYARRGSLWIALALSLAVAAAFAVEGAFGDAGGNPVVTIGTTLSGRPLRTVAPALGLTVEEASERLAAAGVRGAGPADTLAALAARTGTDPVRLVVVLARTP